MADPPARNREPRGRERPGSYRAAQDQQHGNREKYGDAQGQQHYTITPA